MKEKKFLYYGLPLLGTLFCLWYVKAATCDIVYTDYIRLVNSYLPDVWNPEKFFVPDVLTRIPIHYLGRIINVTFFGYSTTFDMALGVLGLGLSGLVFGMYFRQHGIGMAWYLFFTFLLFGLNKWEMLTNGTGWGHFWAFAGFYYHYLVFDRVLYGQEKPHDRVKLLVLPAVITLGLAGPYCAVYSVVMVMACAAAWVMSWMRNGQMPGDQVRDSQMPGSQVQDGRMRGSQVRNGAGKAGGCFWLAGIVSVAVPLFLYLWSNSYAVEDHAGSVDIGMFELAAQAPVFFPRFLLKSLASMVIGGETLTEWIGQGKITDNMVCLFGFLLAAGYLLALYLNLRCRLYRRTMMPLLLLTAGMGNHAIVLVSRYIFVNENYGMSSRYALQYQAGILGIILTFACIGSFKKKLRSGEYAAAEMAAGQETETVKGTERWLVRTAACMLCLLLLAGHGYTDYVEWKKAPAREAYGRAIEAVAVQFESVSDDVLRETFDYRKSRPDSGAKVRSALTILKEHGWNVFGR